MAQYRLVSADSHMCEPPNLWVDRIDKQYRDRAPRTVKGHDGKEGEFFVCENISPIPIAGAFGAGIKAEDLPGHNKKGFEAAPASVWDPAARLKEQDADGISAEVLYTTFGMMLYGLNDAALRAACFKAYNDFVAEYTSYNPNRLVGTGLITLEDIPAGVAELKRCVDKGLRGAMIWASPPDEKPYSHPDYDPFWAAAQDLEVPLSLHILTGRGGTGIDLNKFLTSYMSLPAEIQRTLSIMVFGGVFERFPKLQLVSAENDVSWIPHFMYRLDHAYDRFRHFEGVNLSMLPSEYVRRNVVATFQFEKATADFTRQLFGAERLMWSSDYPHTDSTWPKSREFIADAFKGMPEADIQKIVGGNVARVYRLSVN